MKRRIRPSLIIKLVLWVVLPLLAIKYPIECTIPVSTTKEGKVTTYKYEDYIHRLPSEFDGEIYKFEDQARSFDLIKSVIQPNNYEREIEAGIEEYIFKDYDEFKRYMVKSYLSDEASQSNYYGERNSELDYTKYNRDLFSKLEKDFKLGPDETIDDFFKKEFEAGKVIFVAAYNSRDYDFELLSVRNYSDKLDISVFYNEKNKKTYLYPYQKDRVVKEFVVIEPKYPAVNITINEYHKTEKYYDRIGTMFMFIIILFVYGVYYVADIVIVKANKIANGPKENKYSKEYIEKLSKSDNIVKEIIKDDIKGTINEFDKYIFVKDQTDILNDEKNEEDEDDPIKFM